MTAPFSNSVRFTPRRADEARLAQYGRRASTPCNRASNADSRANGSALTAAHGLGAVLAALALCAILGSVSRLNAGAADTWFLLLLILLVVGACGVALLSGRRL